MSDRYPGGLITKTPVVPAGPYQDGAAPGIWTLEQQAYYAAQGLWPIAGNTNPGDPYYNYVTMLLNGDGTNGGQNNTFLDSSSNAFTITRNGNTTQGSFSPYGSLWSNYFDGSGNYLTVANNAALNVGSSDFTLEAWVYLNSTSNQEILVKAANSSTYPEFELRIESSKFKFYSSSSSSAYNTQFAGATTVTTGQWYHVAVTRNGSSYTIWLNGASDGTATSSSTIYSNTDPVSIGAYGSGGTVLNGYVGSARLVKGTAVYTTTFTPPTAPLTAVSGTSLLTCQSNRFIDNSSNAFAITVNGTPSVQRFSPFNPTASYTTATIGGSGYFDGSGDYLNSTLTGQSIGSGDFTIETYFYPTSFSGDKGVFQLDTSTSPSNNGVGVFTQNSTGKPSLVYDGAYTVGSQSIALNSWNHIAVVRSSSTITMYVNGVSSASVSNSTNFTGTVLLLGTYYTASTYVMPGYLSNFRYVKGTAVYTTTFTPPTSPVTAISGTQFLGNFTNASIPDYAMMNDLETVGNAQVSTSVKKFGTGSISLSASGNTLQTKALNPDINVGSGNFTIEGWVNITTVQGSGDGNGVFQMSSTVGGFAPNQSANLALGVSEGTGWQVYAKNTYTSASLTVNANTWYHFALVRNGTTTVLYINGTSLITLTSDTTTYNTPYIGVGSIYDSTSYPTRGYIDDLRITKGYARYTANFTPPTSAFYTY